jgi:6-phosphogluconolactonase
MQNTQTLFIGAYTKGNGGKADGIYEFTLNAETEALENLHVVAETVNPSYLALSPSKKFLYAVNETNETDGKPNGAVSAFSLDSGGRLRFLNRQSSEGKSPCHAVIDRDEKYAVIANYADGVLAALPLAQDGSLEAARQVIRFSGSGPNAERQEGAHAHSFFFDTHCRFGFACDLGSDRVMAYRFAAASDSPLSSAPIPWTASKPGAGPRHGVFHPSGRFAYVVNELDSTVDVLSYDETHGSFQKMQSLSTLPLNAGPPSLARSRHNTAAAIKISADGHFLYCSNRGHDSIACFKVGESGGGFGALEEAGHFPALGKSPRDFAIDPSGSFLVACNQDSDQAAVFRIERFTGGLTPVGEYEVPSPVCVLFE